MRGGGAAGRHPLRMQTMQTHGVLSFTGGYLCFCTQVHHQEPNHLAPSCVPQANSMYILHITTTEGAATTPCPRRSTSAIHAMPTMPTVYTCHAPCHVSHAPRHHQPRPHAMPSTPHVSRDCSPSSAQTVLPRPGQLGQRRLRRHGGHHHHPRNFHHAMPTTPQVSSDLSPNSAPSCSTSPILW